MWGTISDWFMIGVTALTAYYLYKTLQSQKEVQRTQTELFKIESIRFRESIKPILKYAASTDKMRSEDKDRKILTIEVTNETESSALKVSRILPPNDQTPQLLVATGLSDSRDHLAKGDNPLLFHFLVDPKLSASGWVVFSLSYQDVAGTKYRQGVVCICDNYGIELNPYLPEIIAN